MECPICFEPILKGHLVTDCCQKPFHIECHRRCIQENPACPLCRTVTIQVDQPVETRVVVLSPVPYIGVVIAWIFIMGIMFRVVLA
jgi:hypothetical protein